MTTASAAVRWPALKRSAPRPGGGPGPSASWGGRAALRYRTSFGSPQPAATFGGGLAGASRQHHRPDTLLGEDLEQKRVGHPAVQDVGLGHPRPQGPDHRGDLGDHPLGQGSALEELLELAHRRLRDQAVLVARSAYSPSML